MAVAVRITGGKVPGVLHVTRGLDERLVRNRFTVPPTENSARV